MTTSVTAWIPPTSTGMPMVCGARGFGPEVIEQPVVDWTTVTDRSRTPFAMLIGSPGKERESARDALVDSYLSSRQGATVRYLDGEQANADAFHEEWREMHRKPRDRRLPRPRLVVLSLDESSDQELEWDYRLGYLGQSIFRIGSLVEHSLLIVPPVSHVVPWRLVTDRELVEVFVLDEVSPSPEAGHAIATGLREELSSPAGFTALLEGAPVEWAMSYGSAATH